MNSTKMLKCQDTELYNLIFLFYFINSVQNYLKMSPWWMVVHKYFHKKALNKQYRWVLKLRIEKGIILLQLRGLLAT